MIFFFDFPFLLGVSFRVAADTALPGLAFLDTLQKEFADRQDILKCPHFPVSDVQIADNLMASGAILVSEIFEVEPPLIPRIEPFNTEPFIRALIWEFVGAVTEFFQSLQMREDIKIFPIIG